MLRQSVKVTDGPFRHLQRFGVVRRCLAQGPTSDAQRDKHTGSSEKVHAMVGHNFPDFIEKWNRSTYKIVGNGLIAATALCAVGGVVTASAVTMTSVMPSAVLGAITAGYWYVGTNDIQQTSHAIRRNFPVIGNLRYVLETVRSVLRSRCPARVREKTHTFDSHT